MSTELDDSGLVRFLAELDDVTVLIASEIALEIGATAEERAPVDTGALKQSGTVEEGARPGQFEVRFGDGLPDERAAAQEFGTIYHAPQPYIGPSVDQADIVGLAAEQLQALAARCRV